MPSISTPELKSLIDRDGDFLLVNTLPSESFSETKLPGAVNIPEEQPDFAERVEDRAGGKDAKIVVYCASIDCDSSTIAAEKLDEAGFTNVHDYRGGARAWSEDVAGAKSHSKA